MGQHNGSLNSRLTPIAGAIVGGKVPPPPPRGSPPWRPRHSRSHRQHHRSHDQRQATNEHSDTQKQLPHSARYHKEVIRLRPYQAEAARAVLADVRSARGSTFTVMMSRQAGKNELSAWLEKVLLTLHIASGGTGVKCAPTFRPQLLTSIERLRKHLTDAGYGKRIHAAEGFKLGVGKALWTFLSASPDTNVVGATASILLEADEAQDIAPDKFNKDFRPMAATTNATTVLYGTPWSDDTLLQTTIASNLERQRDDRHPPPPPPPPGAPPPPPSPPPPPPPSASGTTAPAATSSTTGGPSPSTTPPTPA